MKSEHEMNRIGSCFPLLSAFRRKETNILKIFPKKILKHMRLASFMCRKGTQTLVYSRSTLVLKLSNYNTR